MIKSLVLKSRIKLAAWKDKLRISHSQKEEEILEPKTYVGVSLEKMLDCLDAVMSHDKMEEVYSMADLPLFRDCDLDISDPIDGRVNISIGCEEGIYCSLLIEKVKNYDHITCKVLYCRMDSFRPSRLIAGIIKVGESIEEYW